MNMTISIPRHKKSLTFNRSELPQIQSKDVPEFLETLRQKGIGVSRRHVNPSKMKATQSEFNLDKVKSMMQDKSDVGGKPSISSRDRYVLDGHHRWLKDHNLKQKHDTIHIDLPIHDLISHAHAFGKSFRKSITEQRIEIIRKAITEARAKRKTHPEAAYGWFNDKGTFIRNRKNRIHGETYKKWMPEVSHLNHKDWDDYEKLIGHAQDRGWARVDIHKDDDFNELHGVVQNRPGKWTPRHLKNMNRVIAALGARRHKNHVDHIQESETHGWIDHEGKWRATTPQQRQHIDVYMAHLKDKQPDEHNRIMKSMRGSYRQLNQYTIDHAKRHGWLHTYVDKDGYGMIAGKKAAFEKHKAAVDNLKSRYKAADITDIREVVE